MAVYVGGDKCSVIYVARNGQQVRVSSVWVGDQQVFPDVFILRVGVTSGYAYDPLREWAVSIGKTYQTITEITVPMKVIGPSLYSLFNGCAALKTIPALDTSQVTNMNYMFEGCKALTSVPALDTSQVTEMFYTFRNCSALKTIPALDTSKVTNMSYMFEGCQALTAIPALDTSQVTNMGYTFSGCRALTTIPAMNTGKVTSMGDMFSGCSSLTTIPAMNASKVTNMNYMFSGCSSLTTIPAMNASKAMNMYYMFYNCSSLESVTLPGMGTGFTATRTLDMKSTKLNAAAANALMQSLGTVPAAATGSTLALPSTSAGADTSIATAKNWQVTIG